MRYAYLVDVLSLELRDELVETVAVSLDSDGLENGLDIGGGWAGVSTEAEKEVCCHVLHVCGSVWSC